MKKAKKLLLNTLLLTASSFIMQTIAVTFNVYLTNKIGSAGIGLFQLIMTVYSMSVTFSCGGVRLSATRMTVDSVSSDIKGSPNQNMRSCMKYALFLSVCVAIVLFLSADFIAARWLFDKRTAMPLRILAIGLPFVSLNSAINGYFTAVRTVFKSAAILGFEQAVKIVTVVLVLQSMLPKGVEYACEAIVIGMTVSEVAALIVSFIVYRISKDLKLQKALKKKKEIFSELLKIAVPDAVGSCARSILLSVEHLLIPVGFRKSGNSSEAALSVYGTIHGMVFPILLYPSAILTSLSGLLVPELAECNVQNRTRQIEHMIQKVIHITVLFSIGVAGILYAFADGLSFAIYNKTDPAFYLKILAPLIPIMYLDMSVDGMLKGLNQQVYSMRYNIFDSGLCVILVYFLLPRYSVKGYMFILFASEIINFFLSFRRLIVVTNVKLNLLRSLIKPAICIVSVVFFLKAIIKMIGFIDITGTAALVTIISLSAVIYILVLFPVACLSSEDVKWFKQIIM